MTFIICILRFSTLIKKKKKNSVKKSASFKMKANICLVLIGLWRLLLPISFVKAEKENKILTYQQSDRQTDIPLGCALLLWDSPK